MSNDASSSDEPTEDEWVDVDVLLEELYVVMRLPVRSVEEGVVEIYVDIENAERRLDELAKESDVGAWIAATNSRIEDIEIEDNE